MKVGLVLCSLFLASNAQQMNIHGFITMQRYNKTVHEYQNVKWGTWPDTCHVNCDDENQLFTRYTSFPLPLDTELGLTECASHHYEMTDRNFILATDYREMCRLGEVTLCIYCIPFEGQARMVHFLPEKSTENTDGTLRPSNLMKTCTFTPPTDNCDGFDAWTNFNSGTCECQ